MRRFICILVRMENIGLRLELDKFVELNPCRITAKFELTRGENRKLELNTVNAEHPLDGDDMVGVVRLEPHLMDVRAAVGAVPGERESTK